MMRPDDYVLELGTALAFIATLFYFRKRYYHLFQRRYVDPVLKEIDCWKRTAEKLDQVSS